MTLVLSILLILTAIFAAALLYKYKRLREEDTRSDSEDLEIEKAINYFSNSLFGQNTVDEILWDITKNCISQLHFEDCVIYLYDEEKQVFVQKAAFGPKNPQNFEIFHRIEIPPGSGIVGTVGATGIPEIINDTSIDQRYIVDDAVRASEIAVPIVYQGKILGVIDSEHSQKNFFREKHLHILETIASLCAIKISRSRIEQAYRAAEVRLHENSKKIAENRLSVLRAQINPRFLLTSLGSVNSFIQEKDPEKASLFLTQFSSLLQLIFENSKHEWIPLEKEIQTLSLYIELENMRCNNCFDVLIDTNESINQSALLVPPLLVLPIVEDSILYLLEKKRGRGLLNICYWLNNERLFISVEDNGAERAEENESETSTCRQNTLANNERIKIMNDLFGAAITCTTTGLYNEHQVHCGTRILFSIASRKLVPDHAFTY